jgi:hypothetical protein
LAATVTTCRLITLAVGAPSDDARARQVGSVQPDRPNGVTTTTRRLRAGDSISCLMTQPEQAGGVVRGTNVPLIVRSCDPVIGR